MIKNIFIAIFISGLIASCTRTSNIEQNKNEIINTDKSFSKLSLEKGMYEAFLKYADDSVVKPRDGNFPIIGKKEMEKSFAGKPRPDFILSWQPVKVDVAASGELGYTFGNWEMKTTTNTGIDTVLFGNYVSIWKKQRDGSWKYVFDTGNDTPKPQNETY